MDIVQEYYGGSKTPKSKKWYIKGKENDEGLLKQEEYNNNGIIVIQKYFKEGKLHKDFNEPAFICYNKDGTISSQIWFKDGNEHRDNEPAFIYYNENGKILSQGWYKDGVQYIPNEVKSVGTIIDNYKQKEKQYFDNKCPHCKCDIKLTYTIVKED